MKLLESIRRKMKKVYESRFCGVPVSALDTDEVQHAILTGKISKSLEEQIDQYYYLGLDQYDKVETELSDAGKVTPLKTQVGGSHYKKYAIQPIEYAMANDLNYCQANVVKYTTRYRDKNGKEDLRKAIHNLELLISLEYPQKT